MKTSNVLASLFFSALAAAAPVDRRALVTKTEVVVETVVVYTTIWDDEVPTVAAPTVTPAQFHEQPKSPEAKPTPTPAYTPPAVKEPVKEPVKKPSSAYTPTPEPIATPTPTPTPAPKPEPVNTPAPVSTPKPVNTPAPKVEPSPVYTPPAPVSSSEAPAKTIEAPVVAKTETTGESYHGDLTIHYYAGALGSCGKPLADSDMVVALAQPLMGAPTYDTMTGDATNSWCGKKIVIKYNGKSVPATIMDTCSGCGSQGIDASQGVWDALGLGAPTRLQADWSVVA